MAYINVRIYVRKSGFLSIRFKIFKERTLFVTVPMYTHSHVEPRLRIPGLKVTHLHTHHFNVLNEAQGHSTYAVGAELCG